MYLIMCVYIQYSLHIVSLFKTSVQVPKPLSPETSFAPPWFGMKVVVFFFISLWHILRDQLSFEHIFLDILM